MVTLERKNIALQTEPDFSVQIEDQNPFTKFDAIQGGKAIGITIPANDHNRAELGNPERFEKMGTANDRKFENYVIRHHGQPVIAGTLIVEDTDEKSYSGWLRDVIGNLAERVKGKYINSTTLGGEKTFENKVNYDPDTDDYCCPKLFNRHFWRDRGRTVTNTKELTDLEGNTFAREEEIGALTLQFLQNEQYFVNCPGNEGVVIEGTDNAPVVSPFLFLWKAIEMIFFDLKIQVTENFLKTDPDLKRLIIYHTWNIAKQEFTTNAEVIYPVNLFDPSDTLPREEEVITVVAWSTDKLQYKDLLPKTELGDFLLGLQNKLNIVFDFNGIDEVRILDRETVLVSDAFDLEQYATGIWKLGTRKDVCIVLKSDTDSGDAAFSDNWQDLSDLREYIKEPVVNRGELNALTPELDEIRLVTGENSYYQYHWHTPEAETTDGSLQQRDILGWEKISIRFQPYFFNDGDRDQENISSSIGTVRQSNNGYPITQQQGNSAAFKTQFADFAPRLLFYLGNEIAGTETNTLSLDYDGDKGLAANRFRYTLPFLANALPGKRTFKLPASIYYYIRQNKAAMPFRTAEGSFIIDSITAVAGRASTIECELSVLKREDNFWEYITGTIPGTGGITPPPFVPKYVAITDVGKPVLISETGVVKSPPAWNALSTSKRSAQWCVDYSATDKLLFVGCANGNLAIFDLSDLNNLRMKTIRIFAGAEICSVTLVNGRIVIGKAGGRIVFVQPYFNYLGGYADGQASDTGPYDSHVAGCLNHVVYVNGWYYGFTDRGEINISQNLAGWEQTMDWVTCFNRAVVTDSKIWALSDNDRQFWKNISSGEHGAWTEWDISRYSNPTIIEGIHVSGDTLLAIIDEDFWGARMVSDPANTDNLVNPSSAQKCRGAAVIDNKIILCIRDTYGSTKLAIGTKPPALPEWTYIVVPELYQKLFVY